MRTFTCELDGDALDNDEEEEAKASASWVPIAVDATNKPKNRAFQAMLVDCGFRRSTEIDSK